MSKFYEKYKVPLHQTSVFCITAGLYSMLHASRTAWAYAKPTLVDEHGYTNTFLSVLDFSFLCAYAAGLFLSGWLGDRLRLKTLLAQGMLLTVFALMNFSLIGGFLEVSSLLLGIPLFGLLGLAQSSGFPTCITILTNWFHAGQRGLIFGAWMTNINIGNIFGQQLGKIFLDILHYPWPYLLLLCAGIIFVMVLIVLRYLYVTPADAGIAIEVEPEQPVEPEPAIQSIQHASPEVIEETTVETAPTASDLSKPRAIGFWEAWKMPGVLLYAIVFICTKATTSALLFWLPTYLKQEIGFEHETADLLAFFEIGSLIGVIGLGWVSDKFCNKAVVIMSSLFGATVIFFVLNFIKSPDEKSTFMILLLLGGFLIGGPSGLIAGAVSSEIGEKKGKEGGENSEKVKATSTITGIIDGSGTVGAAIIQPIVPLCRSHSFMLYACLLLIATALTPLAQRQASKEAAKGMAASDQNNPVVQMKELQVYVKE